MSRSSESGPARTLVLPSHTTQVTDIAAAPPIVALSGVSKRFGGAAALNSIDLQFQEGQVHGLVGANGAGKSTLGRIIGGIHQRDSGEIKIDGKPVGRWTPADALGHGIAMIQQELALVPALTVTENVFLGIETNRRGMLVNDLLERYEELEEWCGFGLKPDTPVGQLRIAERQKVEIMRALARDSRLLIMDEPTSALTRDEAENLHEIVRRLQADGTGVVYVSHFLDMVLDVTDVVTVLRNGDLIKSTPSRDETPDSLVEAMTGTSLELTFPPRPSKPSTDTPVVLRVEHVSVADTVQDVSLEVREGEIVGIAGLVGAGRSELLRAIFGADRRSSGTVEVDGQILDGGSSKKATKAGLAMIPEDRRGQGLIMTMRVRQNVTLPHLPDLSRWSVISGGVETSRVQRMIDAAGVTPPKVDADVRTLSGGNQQKVLFSKWLFGSPKVILLDEPTRGVDVASKRAIYDGIIETAERGVGVLLVSSEFEEVLELSHRVHVMHLGKFVRELDPTEIDHDELMRAAFNLEVDAIPAEGHA
jgi:ribose transport system ATP-binding protein